MPKIIPIRDLAKTSMISEMCSHSREPIYVTKNGYADLVVMSAAEYDAQMARYKMYEAVMEGHKDIVEGKTLDGFAALQRLGEKYGYKE